MQDIIDYLSNLFLSFWGTFREIVSNIFQWIGEIISVVFVFFGNLIKDIFLWLFDMLLYLVDLIVCSMCNLPDNLLRFTLQGLVDDIAASSVVNDIGLKIISLFGYIGLPEAIGLIGCAFLIRLTRDIVRV